MGWIGRAGSSLPFTSIRVANKNKSQGSIHSYSEAGMINGMVCLTTRLWPLLYQHPRIMCGKNQ